MPSFWITLLAFVLAVIILYLVQRWITRHIQGVGILLFNSSNAGMALLWFLLFPGLVIHETSHWLMAQLLGVPTGRLRLRPTQQGKQIILGSVEVKRTDPLRDSLVGLAPFLAGSLALLAIGSGVFDVAALGRAWESGAWNEAAQMLLAAFQVNDAWLWLYLMVAISNAMMPSPSDRESWRSLLFYVILVLAIMLLFGWSPSLPVDLTLYLTDGLRILIYTFVLAALIDLIFALLLAAVELILSTLRRRKVLYH
ncbi:MAG: hypothetical protein WAZ19_14715 [Anaerolineae bacterium]